MYTDKNLPERVSYLMTESSYASFTQDKTIEIGDTRSDPYGSTFCVPSEEMDELLKNAYDENGFLDHKYINEKMGVNWDEDERLVRIDIEQPDNLREPTGEEGGVNEKFEKTGYTSGGVKEYVMNVSDNPEYFGNGNITLVSEVMELEEEEGIDW